MKQKHILRSVFEVHSIKLNLVESLLTDRTVAPNKFAHSFGDPVLQSQYMPSFS